MTPAELNQLRENLPPFAEGSSLPAGLQDYLHFYDLDFSQRYPGAQYNAGTIQSGQFSLFTQRWLLPNARANLLLVHGYFDHAGIYDKLIDYGLSRGCSVLIFDLPGHGLSTGERAVIDDFADYGRAVNAVIGGARLPPLPLYALGQSTGCAALILNCVPQSTFHSDVPSDGSIPSAASPVKTITSAPPRTVR